MYRTLQKYSKILMAVIGVLLMIVFILPAGITSGPSEIPIGTMGDEEITSIQVQNAQVEWQMVQRYAGPYLGLPPEVVVSFDQRPEMLVLLQREAERLGIQADMDRVNTLLANDPLVTAMERDRREALVRGLMRMSQILQSFERAASVIKISDPVVRHTLAQQQQATVRLIEVPADTFAGDVPPPTREQLAALFDQYKDVTPSQTDPDTNPFGFAYKYPDRVKLQYVQIPRDLVEQAVRATQTEDRWEVDAWKYYLQNQQQFTALPPASTQPTTAPAAPAAPTTQPFEAVKDAALQRVLSPLIEQKMQQVQSAVTRKLDAAQKANQTAHESLEQIAQAVQQETGVLPAVHSLTDAFRTRQELGELEGIGRAFLPAMGLFPQYAISQAEPLVPEEQRQPETTLSLLEPSEPLRDLVGNMYIFRLTDAEAAHVPAGLDEVATQVEQDWRRQQQFELARQRAEQLKAQAEQESIEAAATAVEQAPQTVGPLTPIANSPLPGYPLTGASADRFIKAVNDLMKAEGRHPLTVIELPLQNKLAVAQLSELQSQWTAELLPLIEGQVRQSAGAAWVQGFVQDWFDWDAVQQRLNYQPTGGPAPGNVPPPAAPQRLPLGA